MQLIRVAWTSVSLQWTWGRNTEMFRIGRCKPGPWGSFWTMLTLVGLATRAGEGQWVSGCGPGCRGRPFWP